ncbi:MAG TPA: hypothetical protein V6C81_07340 [Planktothrix sp.]|jgi:hypothetical protein
MKLLSIFAAGLILTMGFSSAPAQAAPSIRAFELGDTRASWITQDGQMVLSLNSPTSPTSSNECGTQTEGYVWASEAGAVIAHDFEFDMLGDSVVVVIEGRYDGQSGKRVLIDLTVKTAGPGWRHVTLNPRDFRGPDFEFGHNSPDTYATKITIVNKGNNMLKGFRLEETPFNVITETSHLDPFREYFSHADANAGTKTF